MTNSPRVSIVTPFLNAGTFLEAAIESVLAQTFDRWELLLVDDGSTDGSAEVARAHGRDPRIRWLGGAHGGPAAGGAAPP